MIRAAALIGLIVICAALTAGFGWMAYNASTVKVAETASAPAPETRAEPASPPRGFQPPPFEGFDALLTRPVFHPDRRPPAPPVQAPQTVEAPAPQLSAPVIEDPELEVVLRGVVTSAAGVVVLLQPLDSGPIVRLSVGEAYEGWRLTALDEEGAIFERDDRETFIGLSYKPAD